MVNKRVEIQYLGTASKVTGWSKFVPKAKITVMIIRVIQVYALTTDAEEAEVDQLYEDLKHFLELTPKKSSFSS